MLQIISIYIDCIVFFRIYFVMLQNVCIVCYITTITHIIKNATILLSFISKNFTLCVL